MTDPIPIAILGFTPFERNAMASFFQLNSRRAPCYQVVLDADAARLVVADADQPGVVSLLRTLGRSADSVFIGSYGPADAAAWMMRPINAAHVMRELDAMVVQRLHKAPSARSSVPLPPPTSGPGDLDPPLRRREAPGGRSRRADDRDLEAALLRRDLAEARRRQRIAALRPQLLRRALLVDDSEIALHFLRRQLEQYGVDTDFARHSDRALDLMHQHRYGMVFIDVDLGEYSTLDGLTLCQQLRQRPDLAGPPGSTPPVLVMVSAFHDPADQVRGALAGADGYLGKPLDFGALDRLLQDHGFSRMSSTPLGALGSGLAPAGGSGPGPGPGPEPGREPPAA